MNYILIDNEREVTIYKNPSEEQLNNIQLSLLPNQKLVPTEKNSLNVSANNRYDEYNNLLYWFNNNYTYKEQKYRRLITLNLVCDDGSNPNDKLLQLYEEAERNRRRIQELELELNIEK